MQYTNMWRNNLLLLVVILILFIVGPAFEGFSFQRIITAILLTALVYSSLFSLAFNKTSFAILSSLGIVVVLLIWLRVFNEIQLLGSITYLCLAAYLFLVTAAMIYNVATSKEVNAEIIFCSINGYLLMGIIGALSFITLDIFVPYSLGQEVSPEGGINNYIYFSYVTLSTLGYGDISPITPVSRSFAVLLSISGQIYLTIVIAMLIGKYLNIKNKS